MRIGIIGLPHTGKRTLFGLLIGADALVRKDACGAIPGTADIRDPRFDALVAHYEPRSRAPARLELELLPDLDARRIQEGKIFRDFARLDALCHVVRAFSDATVYHAVGSVDPHRDIDAVNAELILHDLVFIEKRLERLDHDIKKGPRPEARKERAVLERLQAHLEEDLPLRTLPLGEEERRTISGYPFITMKEMVVAVNAADEALADAAAVASLRQRCTAHKAVVMQISAKLEAEIAHLECPRERHDFLTALGLDEPALHRLSRQCMHALGLISFFTVGKDEVRQWLVPRGATAPQAAGVVHSDIERGFIRAEVMTYDDFMACGGEQGAKRAGKFRVMGRDYICQDGDIINFLFSV